MQVERRHGHAGMEAGATLAESQPRDARRLVVALAQRGGCLAGRRRRRRSSLGGAGEGAGDSEEAKAAGLSTKATSRMPRRCLRARPRGLFCPCSQCRRVGSGISHVLAASC